MKTAVFSGTADGRELCRYLAEQGHEVKAFTATEYGGTLIDGASVHTGRLDAAEMRREIAGYDAVIDATHPYAAAATRNIYAACRAEGIKYYRLRRNATEHPGAVTVPDARAAAEYLKSTEGGIFVSTGSKELAEFEPVGARVTARVLDTAEVREKCAALGIAEIIYKMPPFSYEEDLADFAGCRWLVTKDGGTAGGTDKKLAAAAELGMTVVMLERPTEVVPGYDAEELKGLFCNGIH